LGSLLGFRENYKLRQSVKKENTDNIAGSWNSVGSFCGLGVGGFSTAGETMGTISKDRICAASIL
jgi:hypothetical protein